MTDAAPKTALVIGATSALAQAMCRILAAKGYKLVLAARDAEEMDLLAHDLLARFDMECRTIAADLMANDFSPEMLMEHAGDVNYVIIATGDMGSGDPMSLSNLDFTMRINYTLPAMIATVAAQRFAEKKRGTIVIISSVAGDRGREKNYIYGTAKAALTTFASGLRQLFYKKGVHVMTVKPGFIDTQMTWGMKSPLIASPEYVAAQIIIAMERKKDVIYVPFFWRFIMLIILHIPERIFKKLSL